MIATAEMLGPPGLSELSPKRRRLVEKNMKLAFREAADSDVPLDADERESAALWGLCLAARDFEEGRGYRFSSFAVPIIRRHLERAAQNEAWTIHIPAYMQAAGAEARDSRDAAECRAAADRARRRASLRHDIARPASDSPAAIVEAADEQAHLLAAIDRLSAPQREAILDGLAGLNRVESAALRGVTPEAIRTRLGRAVATLRSELAGGAA